MTNPESIFYREMKEKLAALEKERDQLRAAIATVTTEDTCSNCGAKLTNAETARLNWQGEAARLDRGIRKALKVADGREEKLGAYWELTERLESLLNPNQTP